MVGLAAIAELFGGNAGTEELQAFYPIRPNCLADIPKTRFRPRVTIFYCSWCDLASVRKTLSARRWHAAFFEDGHLDIEKVLRTNPTRSMPFFEFYLYLVDHCDSTFRVNHPREMYAIWKTKCKNMVLVIGSGKYITRPIIIDDGQSIEGEDCRVTSAVSDKKVVHWMLFPHQIGMYGLIF
ncbi:hypothetical protein J1N35_026812 [Gossypium stocksii]|uniref:Uncharacterized protein n=1 Tax=Gossypium stocksii TaxID=47602 RepID=A0A9D3V932_9ROSI|nr:hypothetical protein J1N35_026812 [Gossypium stocksii]